MATDSTRALTGNRLLHEDVPGTLATFLPTNLWAATNGWQTLTNDAVYYESYFDLSAYELDDLTLVPTAIALQDGMPYTTTSGDPIRQLPVFDIVSQERLTVQEIYDNYIASAAFPGSTASTEDWSQILMCNFRLMLPQADFTNIALLLPATGGSFGSSEPTAVQKLWYYRIAIPTADDLTGSTWLIPPSRFVLGAEIIKEDDLPYMMRLKRSYELSTQG
ncbi:MAG: hypothetical protein [Circular genetic element sp.]|nr:MAG: hypothetical protein [Circular genetic element sp.]